jgi:hypothetical protein
VTNLIGGDAGAFLAKSVLFAIAAMLTGRVMAETWRPGWQIAPVALALAATHRFLLYALFGARFLSAGGFAIAALLLGLFAAASYYRARARTMVRQYPWLYERSGPFGWHAKPKEPPP